MKDSFSSPNNADGRRKMNKAFQIVVLLLGLAAVASFVGCFIANLELIPFLDPERVRKKTGGNGMWYSGSRVTPIEFYREEAWPIWRVRDRFSKAFMICAGFFLVTIIAAVMCGLPFWTIK